MQIAGNAPLVAFGSRAASWARSLPPDLSAVVVDIRDDAAVQDAYAEAIRRRMAADPFFVATVIPNTGVELALAVSGALIEHSYDDRRQALDQLSDGSLEVNGQLVTQLSVLSAETIEKTSGLHVLADAILVHSHVEYTNQTLVLGRFRRHVCRYSTPAPIAAGLRSTRDGGLVVWAPELPWEKTMLFVTALEEMRMPVTIVAASVPPRAMPVRYVLASEGLAALSSAIAVIDTEPFDPGPALSFAELGVPVVAANTTGIDEYADNVGLYIPWEWRRIQSAAYDALGARPPKLRQHGFDLRAARDTLESTVPNPPSDGPLVSIIIPTYNRPKRLERVLRSFANQAYENVECIVVNDAGVSVDDVVAQFPKARVIDLAKNSNDGGTTPVNEGAKHVRGKYVGFMADDDVCYPDHLARLVEVLERTGVGVAHANIAIRFLRSEGDREVTAGFRGAGAVCHLDPYMALLSSPVSLTTALIRRDVLEAAGYYSKEFWAIADNELMLRLSLHSDCAHVDHVTTEWRVDIGGSNRSMHASKAMAEQIRKMWSRHPCADRPRLHGMRAQAVADVEKLAPGELYVKPAITFARDGIADFE